MMPAPCPPLNPALPSLLRRASEQLRAGDSAAWQAALDDIWAAGSPSDATGRATTLLGALCLGGAEFAARVALHGQADAALEDGYAAAVDAFCAITDAAAGQETRLAEYLRDTLVLPTPASAVLDVARADLLVTAGPLEEVPQAALVAMQHAQWDTALRGFTRLHHALQDKTPRNTFGMASVCLHKLGRYEEAEAWAQAGLGSQREQMVIAPVHSEAELLARWAGRQAPEVSIVCTTYNHERYIENALRGFLSQDCDFPFEILIHDDASTDRTQDVIRRWQAQYPRIIKPVLQTTNQLSQGVRPFELLLARATGNFVACCEGDDFWIDPTKLTRQVGFLKDHPDFSCSAHNYLHYLEAALTVRPWTTVNKDVVLSQRQLTGVARLLWLPTLVFRRSFSTLPAERDQAGVGDQFLTSYLGTFGRCMYFETLIGAVRRENEFSIWSPLPKAAKERLRVKTWVALIRLHQRLGNAQAVADLTAKIAASKLDTAEKATLLGDLPMPQTPNLAVA